MGLASVAGTFCDTRASALKGSDSWPEGVARLHCDFILTSL